MIYSNANDVNIGIKSVYGEARGEPVEGQIAMLWCLLNRAALARMHPTRMFGDGSLAGACLAPYQLSCWNPGPIRDKLNALRVGDDRDSLRVALTVLGVLIGDVAPPTVSWWSARITHYHVATDNYPSGWKPKDASEDWVPPTQDGVIGRHAFYSEDKVP